MSKMYLPSQDEVIEGLAPDIYERGETNAMIKGHGQEFEMSHPFAKVNNDISELVHDNSYEIQVQGDTQQIRLGTQSSKSDIKESNKKWAEELGRADERVNNMRLQFEETYERKT